MLNNVVLVGRVVRQPEIIPTQEGKQVSNLTIAVVRAFKNSTTGEYDTDFITITLWENLAKNVVEYCNKGDILGIRGRLVHRSYEIPNYKTLRTVEVVAERVSFIHSKSPEVPLQTKKDEAFKHMLDEVTL